MITRLTAAVLFSACALPGTVGGFQSAPQDPAGATQVEPATTAGNAETDVMTRVTFQVTGMKKTQSGAT